MKEILCFGKISNKLLNLHYVLNGVIKYKMQNGLIKAHFVQLEMMESFVYGMLETKMYSNQF